MASPFNACEHVLRQLEVMTERKTKVMDTLRRDMYLDHMVKLHKFELEQLEADLTRTSKLASRVCAPQMPSLFKY